MNLFIELKRLRAATVAGLVMTGAALAADAGTAAEAEALVKKAVAHIKSAGPEKAYDEFTNGKGWVEGYTFMNPVSQKMEGKAMYIERVGDTLVGCGIYKG